jgi:hypothetical protein
MTAIDRASRTRFRKSLRRECDAARRGKGKLLSHGVSYRSGRAGIVASSGAGIVALPTIVAGFSVKQCQESKVE